VPVAIVGPSEPRAGRRGGRRAARGPAPGPSPLELGPCQGPGSGRPRARQPEAAGASVTVTVFRGLPVSYRAEPGRLDCQELEHGPSLAAVIDSALTLTPTNARPNAESNMHTADAASVHL
jgi:hypothetical protein